MTNAPKQSVFDKFSGQLLGTVVHIEGDQITYKAIGVPSFHTIKSCWVMVWNN